MSQAAEIEELIGKAIEDAILEQENGFTLKWIAVVESVGEDGTRGVWTLTSPDARKWDTLGLLEYAKLIEGERP